MPIHPRSIVCLALIAGLLAAPAHSRPRDWLDLRRGGGPAIAASARAESALQPWSATYRAKLEAGHPLAPKEPGELVLLFARGPAAAGATGGDALAVFAAPPLLKGVGVVVHAGKGWLRLPGGKAVPATAKLLVQPLPGLQIPLIALVPLEIAGLHSPELEGEFDDTAMLRLKPEYTAGSDVPAMKAGVSKRFGVWCLGEVDDRKGQVIALVEWMELAERKGLGQGLAQVVPAVVRLQPKSGNRAAVTLQLVTATIGKAPAFAAKSLK